MWRSSWQHHHTSPSCCHAERPHVHCCHHCPCDLFACRLQDIPGASVEHNNFCVSAHFRNCASDSWQRVVLAVNDSVAVQPGQLHVTRGRKVLEIRPMVSMADLLQHAMWRQSVAGLCALCLILCSWGVWCLLPVKYTWHTACACRG